MNTTRDIENKIEVKQTDKFQTNSSNSIYPDDASMLGTRKDPKEEEDNKRLAVIMDIFQHLDDFNDGLLHLEEVNYLLKHFQLINPKENTEEQFKAKFEKHQVQKMLNFERFAKFIEELGLQEKTETIRDELFNQNFGWPITRCFFACCKSKIKNFRGNKMKERMLLWKGAQLTHQEDHSLMAKAKKKATETGQIIAEIFQAYGIAADHFSDWYLFNQIYWIGVKKENRFDLNYKIVTIITLMAISSTFLITYSSYVNFLKDSGKFEPLQMAKKSCFSKLRSYLTLTFLGPFIFVLISPLEMLKGILQLPVFIIKGKNGYQAVDLCFQYMIQQLTGLNKLQLKYMVDQRKISQLFFESIPLLFMQILILVDVIQCPEIVSSSLNAIILSLVTAIFSIIMNFTMLSFQSSAFREPFSLYALTTLNAKQNWIPFLWQVESRQIKHSINYSLLEIPIPGITNKLGIFQTMKFQFSDQTLLYFSNKLSIWETFMQAEEKNDEEASEVYKPTFQIGKSLELVSFNTLLHFILNFPFEHLNLEIDGVDWQNCLEQSRLRGLIYNTKQTKDDKSDQSTNQDKQKYLAYTHSNVPLLFVCVDNEPKDSSEPWLLESCMKELLNENFDPDIRNKYGELLFTYAIQNKKKRSIEVLVDYADLTLSDQRGMSILGQAIISEDFNTFDLVSQKIKGSEFLNNVRIFDARISLKSITLIEYFCKKCQGYKNSKEQIPEMLLKIHKLIVERGYKFKTEDEIQKFFRSCAKAISQRAENTDNHSKILQMFSEIAKMSLFDIFGHKDKKKRTFGYVLCKFIAGRPHEYQDTLNSYKQLKDHAHLFSQETFENVLAFVIKQIWEKNQDNNQHSYGSRIIEKFTSEKTGEQEIILLINEFLPDGEFENTEIQQQILDYLKQCSKKTYRGTYAYNWTDLKGSIFKKLKGKTGDQVIEEHLKDCQSLTFDQRKSMHENYERSFNETNKQEEQQAEKDQIKISDNQKYAVALSKKGKQPEFARYLEGASEQQLSQMSQKLKLKLSKSMIVPSEKKKSQNQSLVEQLFNLVIELVSTFDFITDIWVLRFYIKSQHNMWLALNIFSIVSPLFVCISPYITFKMEKLYTDVYLNNYFPFYRKVMSLMTFTPLIIVFFFAMDIFFLVFSGVATVLILLLRLITFGKFNKSNFTEGVIDKAFNVIFEMSKLDVAGFRRLRTISQLSFESFIQIILQVRILVYQQMFPDDKTNLDISMEAILISLGFALLHTVIEVIFLQMEATATKTTLTHYSIICFNGRFGWVPFSHIFSDPSSATKINQLDYENIESKFLCTKFVMDFQFTDSTMAGLTRAICNLPAELDPLKRMTIKIGESAQQVDIMTLLNLIQVAHQRVNIDVSEVDFQEKLLKAPKNFIKQLQLVEKQPTETPLIFKLAQIDCHQMIKQFLDFGATMDFTVQDGRNMVDLAIQNNDSNLLEVLINNNPSFVNNHFSVIDSDVGQSKLNQFLQLLDYNVLKELCFNENINICHYAQFGLMAQAIDKIRQENKELGYGILNCLYGPDKRIDEFANKPNGDPLDLKQYYNQYPNEVTIFSNDHNCTMATEMAFKFSLLRRVILQHWIDPKINKYLIQTDLTKKHGTPENPISLNEFDMNVENLMTVVDLLQGGNSVGNLTKDQVMHLDAFVKKFHLDKDQWIYNQQSRLNDQTGFSMSVLIKGQSCRSSAQSNTEGKLQSHFSGKGGPNHDNWSYGYSIKFKFPKSALSLQNFEAKYHLTDQGWGGTGSVQMVVETYFKNYAQAASINSINRESSEHPNFENKLDVNQIKEKLGEYNFQQTDLFAFLPEIVEVQYKPSCPPWGGWSMNSNGITISFKVNLDFSSDPEEEKKDYEKLLSEQIEALKNQGSSNDHDDYDDDDDDF